MSVDIRRMSREELDRLNEAGRAWREGKRPAVSTVSEPLEELSVEKPSGPAVLIPATQLILVHRLAYNGDVVAFKMGGRQGGPSRTGGRRAHI
jgi:hypothetical protein